MNNKIRSIIYSKSLRIGFVISLVMIGISSLYFGTPRDITKDQLVYWGSGWNNQQSQYAGSELGFIVENSHAISIEIARNSDADQGVEVTIDGKHHDRSIEEGKSQLYTFSLDPKKPHTVSIRHYCTYLYIPCSISIKQLLIDRMAVVRPYAQNKPILSVLGDSISTMYGKQNYTWMLSDSRKYQLHNASVMGSNISRINDFDSVLDRYEKDLKNIRTDKLIIFLGTNDVKNGIPLDSFDQNYSTIVMNIRNWNIATQIVLVGILPRKDIDQSILSEYNKIIENIANRHNALFVDTSKWIQYDDLADDVHPSIQGQQKIFNSFEKVFSIEGE